MRASRSITVIALGLLSLSPAARAATVADLKPFYEGPAHSPNDAAFEDSGISFETGNIRSGGKFDLIESGFHVPGKVTNGGKVTISGKLQGTSGMQTFNVKLTINAQLSATGKFITGKLRLKGTIDGAPVNQTANFDATGGPAALTGQTAPRRSSLLDLLR